MFTGIIQNTGRVLKWRRGQKSAHLVLKSTRPFRAIKMGESIAINGCCLTVVSWRGGVLEFDVSAETLRKTTFTGLKKNQLVNLERAIKLGERLGGHLVLGHVDAKGKVFEVKKQKNFVEYKISYPKKFSKLLIEKGSVALDGISLTVCDLKKDCFSLHVIPHTLEQTHLSALKKGDAVNLEFDVVGKYVLRARA